MNAKTKKLVAGVSALVVLGLLAFLSSQSNLFQGAFTPGRTDVDSGTVEGGAVVDMGIDVRDVISLSETEFALEYRVYNRDDENAPYTMLVDMMTISMETDTEKLVYNPWSGEFTGTRYIAPDAYETHQTPGIPKGTSQVTLCLDDPELTELNVLDNCSVVRFGEPSF